MSRLHRGWRLGLIVGAALGVGAVGSFLGLTHTQAGQTLVMRQVLKRVERGLRGQIVVGSVHSTSGLHRQATLVDVELTDHTGARVFWADSLSASYSLRGLIAGDIVFNDVDVWNPVARFARSQVGARYGIQTLVRPPEDSASGRPVTRVVLQNVGVHSGRLEIRDPLTEETIPASRRTERSPEARNLVRTTDFEAIDARFTRVTLSDPAVEGILVDVGALSLRGLMFEEPLTVSGFMGRVRYLDGRLSLRADEFRMGVSSRATGLATIDWEGGSPEVELELAVTALDIRDLRWLLPDLPDASGSTNLWLNRDSLSLQIRLGGGDLHFNSGSSGREGGRVSGDATVTWVRGAEAATLSETLVNLDGLDVSIVERMFGVRIPFQGVFGGSFMVDGTFAEPLVKGTLTHGYLDWPVSTVDVSGRLLFGDDPGAENLDITLRHLSLGVVEAYAGGGLDPSRVIEGTISLHGRVGAGLGIRLSTRYPAPEGETSVLALAGTIRRVNADSDIEFDLTGAVDPLYFPGLVEKDSGLARFGRATGTMGVQGPISALRIVTALETPQGRLSVTAAFDGRDPFAGYVITAVADGYDATVLFPMLPEGTVFNGRVDVSGKGRDLDTAVLTASVRLRDAKFAHLAVDSLALDVALRDGLIHVDRVGGVIGRTTVLGSGTLGTSRASNGRLDLEFHTDDLEGIRPLFLGETVIARDTLRGLARDILIFDGIDPDTLPLLEEVQVSGSLTARLELRGALDSLSLSGELTVTDAVYAGSFVKSAHVTFTAEGLPSMAPQITALVESGGIRILGRAFDSASVRLDYREPRGRTDVFLVRSDREDYRVHVAFDWSDSVRVLNLDEMTLRFPEERWNLRGPATVSWDPDGLTFENFRLMRPGAEGFRMSAEGRLPFRGRADLNLLVQRLELERVAHLFQLPDRLEGVVDLDVQMRGTAEAPEFKGTVSVDLLRFRDFAFDRLHSVFSYADRRLTGNAEVHHDGREILAVRGAIPADLALGDIGDRFPDETVDLDVRADSLPLAMLLAPFDVYEDVQGAISGSVSLGGTLEALAPDGEIRLSNGAAYLPQVGVRYQGVEGRVTLHPDGTMDVRGSVHARGSADLSGTVTLKPASDPSLDLQVELSDFQALERRDVEARLSGTVDIRGTYRRPVLSGDLAVREGVLFVEEFIRSAAVLDLGILAADSTASILDPGFLDVPSLIGSENPFLRNVVMRDLTLRFTNNAWVQSEAMRVEMGGELDVFYDRAQQEITLLGTLNAQRGTYRSYGRGFNVNQGTLRFFGTPGINPELDIQATTRLRTADRDALNITANVTGTLLRPRVGLTSDQAGLSQADLIAYMAFGRPAYGLTSSQSQALGNARSLIVGSGVTLGLNSALGPAASGLGLAYLSFTQQDLGAVGSDAPFRGTLGTLGTTVLETGRYVAEDFFVTLFLRPLSTTGAGSKFAGLRLEWAASDAYTVEASIEERFFRGRVVGFRESSLLNLNQKGFGLFFFRDWGY